MGGFPSEEKKEDVEVGILRSRTKDEVVEEVGKWDKIRSSRSISFEKAIETFTSTTPPSEISSRLENFGVLPDLVIMNIALFIEHRDLPKVFRVCRLFYHCGNTNHFWRQYYENNFSKDESTKGNHRDFFYKNILSDEHETNEINWKRRFFFHHYLTDENYRKVYFKGQVKPTTTDDKEVEEPIPLKTVFVGVGNIGKTKFVERIIHDQYRILMGTTIGAAFFSTVYTNIYTNQSFKVELWDTASRERYQNFPPMYYRHTDIVFLCFSLSKRESFHQPNWKKGSTELGFRTFFETMKEYYVSRKEDKPVVILLGLKNDFNEYGTKVEREVSKEEVVEFIKQNEDIIHGYVENSSKDRKNIMLSLGLALDVVSKRLK